MSETRDKRRRTDLDIFILALIDSGVSTPYELQKSAGLSQGATIPALQRLLEARLVRQGKPGVRGRTGYQVSAAGKRLLKDGWRTLIDAGPSGDLDSDLRIALLSILGSGDRRIGADFLRRSGGKKLQSFAGAELTGDPDVVPPLARWYTDLRSGATKALVAAEADAIRAMAVALPRKLAGMSTSKGSPKSKQKTR